NGALVARHREIPAVAGEDDFRLGRPGPANGAQGAARPRAAAGSRSAGARSPAAGGADNQAPDIARAHGGVPVGPDFTGLRVGRNAVVHAVIDENIGIGDAADRSVLVVENGGLPG